MRLLCYAKLKERRKKWQIEIKLFQLFGNTPLFSYDFTLLSIRLFRLRSTMCPATGKRQHNRWRAAPLFITAVIMIVFLLGFLRLFRIWSDCQLIDILFGGVDWSAVQSPTRGCPIHPNEAYRQVIEFIQMWCFTNGVLVWSGSLPRIDPRVSDRHE